MSKQDLGELYQSAARGEMSSSPEAATKALEELRFKLAACVMWSRIQLQDAGFQTDHIASEESPAVHLMVARHGVAHTFKLMIPHTHADDHQQPGLSKKIILSGNADGSLTEFSLYNDDGSLSADRFRTLSDEIARHVAIESGRKALMKSAPSVSA